MRIDSRERSYSAMREADVEALRAENLRMRDEIERLRRRCEALRGELLKALERAA